MGNKQEAIIFTMTNSGMTEDYKLIINHKGKDYVAVADSLETAGLLLNCMYLFLFNNLISFLKVRNGWL